MNVNSTLLRTFRENELDTYMDNEFHIYGRAGKLMFFFAGENDESY